VVLVCTAGPFAERIRAEGVEVIDVPIPRRIDPSGDLHALARLVTVFRHLQPDIVHTHTSKAGFLGRLAARLAGVRRVVHSMHEPPHNAARSALSRFAYIMLERLAAFWADRIVTPSYANEREILERRLVDPRKLMVIRLGIELSRYPQAKDPRAAVRGLGIADDAPVIGIVGRLEPPKGHTHLLAAVRHLVDRRPDLCCVCVGDGFLRERLEAEAEALGIERNVFFTGYREDMLELLCGFDLFVLPSLWEGLGIVLLEAMAYQKAIVASRVGGIQDVVIDGETGILLPPASPVHLARAIDLLLGDRGRAEAMGRAGYLRVLTEFRDDRCNDRLMALYHALLAPDRR